MNLFLTSTAANVMDEIVSRLPKQPRALTLAFIPTAGDPYSDTPWIHEDRKKLLELGFQITDLDIKDKNKAEIEDVLCSSDIIFVAGGNTFYLLEKAIASSFDVLVKKHVRGGKVYIGSSAGSVIAGPNIEAVADFDDPACAELSSTSAFGFVDFVVLPHFGKDKYGPYHDKVMKEFGEKYNIIPITDQQMIISDGVDYKIF